MMKDERDSPKPLQRPLWTRWNENKQVPLASREHKPYKASVAPAAVTDVRTLDVSPKDATRSVATTVDAGRTVLRGGQLVGGYWQDIKSAFIHALNNHIGPVY